MANALYDSGRDGFLKGEFNWSSDAFKVILLSSAYSVNLSSHTTTANIGGTVAISGALSTLVPGSGVADATNITANGSVSLTNSNKFVLTTNPAAYKYFRIYGVAAGTVLAGIASEIYFDVNTTAYQASCDE